MRKLVLTLLILAGVSTLSKAQNSSYKFGDGLRITGKDSSFYMKFGTRFQNLHTSQWSLANDEIGMATDYRGAFMVRRSRFKFDGWILNPNVVYKMEIGLSNRDQGGGDISEFNNASNMILDASLQYTFDNNITILFGQRKLPGNRERVISSGNLQFVDRSRVNSRFNIDRDMGIQLKHKFKVGNAVFKEVAAFSQGEGRNITAGNFKGYEYTVRGEVLPFGEFTSKGDYVGSAIKRETTPKLSLGVTYDINQNAVRERGNLGSFVQDDEGNYYGKDLNTFFVDLMFKYQGLSIMGEYADKATADENPVVVVDSTEVGTFYTGSGFNIQAGYMFKNNYEVAMRYTDVTPDIDVSNNEKHYTFGVSKFIVGHKLKLQTDLSLIQIANRDDQLLWRMQLDVHF